MFIYRKDFENLNLRNQIPIIMYAEGDIHIKNWMK